MVENVSGTRVVRLQRTAVCVLVQANTRSTLYGRRGGRVCANRGANKPENGVLSTHGARRRCVVQQ